MRAAACALTLVLVVVFARPAAAQCSFTTQPTSRTVCPGATAVFSVTATGPEPLTYQWLRAGLNVSDVAGHISGATTDTLTITDCQNVDEHAYSCRLANSCNNLTSSAAILTVTDFPAFTSQPTTVQVALPGGYSFTVGATGTGIAYQWRRSGVNVVNGGRFSGATTATLNVSSSISSDYAAVYDCVVTETCGNRAVSGQASIYNNCDITETEPNDSKGAANAFAMLPGQTLCGTTTGDLTTAGAASLDCFRITVPGTTGILRYRLAIVGETAHSLTLRGLFQSGGIIAAGTDTASQFARTGPEFGRPTLQWYVSGTATPVVYIEVTGTPGTVTPYTIQLSSEVISATTAPGRVFRPGPITIDGTGAGADTELWVYDRNLNSILDFGNDDSVGQLSRLTRGYDAGIYYMALGIYNLANNRATPPDDISPGAPVMDFAGVTMSAGSGTEAFGYTIAGRVVAPVAPKVYEVRWIRFLVGCNIADVAGLGGTPRPDGALTADDIIYYLAQFFAGDLAVADLVGLGGTGAPDGAITPDDLEVFLGAFFSPCI